MSKYINETNFPIKLFNQYDLLPFHSFKEVIDYYKNELRTTRFKYQNLFKEENRNKFLTEILDFFPFIFFVDSKNIDNDFIEQNLKVNLIVKDANKLNSLFLKRVDKQKIYNQLEFISNQNNCKVNYTLFISHLFRYLYKYSFYQITDSLFLDEQNKYCISDYIRDYKSFKNEISNPSDKNFESEFLKINNQEFFKSFTNEFENSISNDSRVIENTITELEIFSTNSNFSKLLYSILDNNIHTPPSMSPNQRNKLLRPLFHEIVCNFTHQDWFELDVDDKALVDIQKNFTRDYKKIFQ